MFVYTAGVPFGRAAGPDLKANPISWFGLQIRSVHPLETLAPTSASVYSGSPLRIESSCRIVRCPTAGNRFASFGATALTRSRSETSVGLVLERPTERPRGRPANFELVTAFATAFAASVAPAATPFLTFLW